MGTSKKYCSNIQNLLPVMLSTKKTLLKTINITILTSAFQILKRWMDYGSFIINLQDLQLPIAIVEGACFIRFESCMADGNIFPSFYEVFFYHFRQTISKFLFPIPSNLF